MGRSEHFGWTTTVINGVALPSHTWPIGKFLERFRGLNKESQEDLKAAVYKWGGPFPSLIEEVFIDMGDEGNVIVSWREYATYGL